ncbi:hypothetical protein WMF45_44910 [Sorangium sp. So ce448]|uniref:hypothetical protein n=1 Tax=Sorangium sp. So ce448 TaxID=3133314 RepID=UPI003F618507
MYDFDDAQRWSVEAIGGFADNPAEEGWTEAFVTFWFPVAVETLGLVFLLKNSCWGHVTEQSAHPVDSWSARTLCERVAEALVARAERGGFASLPPRNELVELHVLATEALLGGLLQDPLAMDEPFCRDCLTHWLKRRGAAWSGAERRPFTWFHESRDCRRHSDRLTSALARVKQPDVGDHTAPVAEDLQQIKWAPAKEIYSVQAIPMPAVKLRAGTLVLLSTLGLGASVAGTYAAAGTHDAPALEAPVFSIGPWDEEAVIDPGEVVNLGPLLREDRESPAPQSATATAPPPRGAIATPPPVPPPAGLAPTTPGTPGMPRGQGNSGDGPGRSPQPEPGGPPRVDGEPGRKSPARGGVGAGPPRIELSRIGTGAASGGGGGAGGDPSAPGKRVLSLLATDLSEAIQAARSKGLTCGSPFSVSGGLKRGARDPDEQDIPEMHAALLECNRTLNEGGSPRGR